MTNVPEFSRPVDIRQSGGKELRLEASEAERAALAVRFALIQIDRLEAEILLEREDRVVHASGRLVAAWVQGCAISAEDLPISLDEPLAFRFVPASEVCRPGEEVEIDADDCDEIEYSGTVIDVGEAVAQSLALAIDPYLTGPDAEDARAALASPGDSGPFAALKELNLKE